MTTESFPITSGGFAKTTVMYYHLRTIAKIPTTLHKQTWWKRVDVPTLLVVNASVVFIGLKSSKGQCTKSNTTKIQNSICNVKTETLEERV